MLKRNSKLAILLISLSIVGYALKAEASSIYAASCSQQDVQTAINSAINGDIVIVPSGTCTWSSKVSLNKAITLQGAGIGSTVIVDNTPSGSSLGSSDDPIQANASNWRITGFTFTYGTSTGYANIAVIGGDGWRIDHCSFVNNNAKRGLAVAGTGLIDHNIFTNTYQGISVFGAGDTSWAQPLSLGTANAIYVEDNTFNYTTGANDGALDAYAGARFVFRYNTVNGTVIGCHGFDSGGDRSTFSYEIYNNTFSKSTTGNSDTMNMRGGTGVIFNNTITGNYWGIQITNYRSYTNYGGSEGQCDGTNANDGNTTPTSSYNGWPCKDQIGRTANQTSYPLHGWNNTLNGSTAILNINSNCAGYCSSHLHNGRDYYSNSVDSAYTPYTYPHPRSTTVNQATRPMPPMGLSVLTQ